MVNSVAFHVFLSLKSFKAFLNIVVLLPPPDEQFVCHCRFHPSVLVTDNFPRPSSRRIVLADSALMDVENYPLLKHWGESGNDKQIAHLVGVVVQIFKNALKDFKLKKTKATELTILL